MYGEKLRGADDWAKITALVDLLLPIITLNCRLNRLFIHQIPYFCFKLRLIYYSKIAGIAGCKLSKLRCKSFIQYLTP